MRESIQVQNKIKMILKTNIIIGLPLIIIDPILHPFLLPKFCMIHTRTAIIETTK